ncbi:SDR family NAD(P)-dependent oxidoreductase [Streptomyces sp. CA-106131]|uniref:SDR family NAD(P)-dependent oxidoreductase n=1 Tax=Streptomyces sp. CA-106131 TaxID=3240045 RepID=UPI003D8A8BD4
MTLSSFDGVTAVVTGAAHGIGRALARQLASQGAGVVAVDVRRDDVEALVRELTDTGHRSLAVTCDVSCRSEVADLGRAVARWAPQGVQLLCNNAGVFTGFLRGCPGLQAGEESDSCGAGQGQPDRRQGDPASTPHGRDAAHNGQELSTVSPPG